MRIKTTIVLALRYLFLTRFSWLAGIVLILLVPVSLHAFPALLGNLFVLDLPAQVYHVSWITMWCAATVMETLRVTTMHAPLRFEDYRIAVDQFREAWKVEPADEAEVWYRSGAFWLMLVLGIAAATAVWHTIMEACIATTVADPSITWQAFIDEEAGITVERICQQRKWAGWATTVVLLGVLNGILILAHQHRTVKATGPGSHRPSRWLQSCWSFLNWLLGPGYFVAARPEEAPGEEPAERPLRPTVWHLAPGHLRLMLYTATFAAWYVVNFVTARGDYPMPTETSPYPALFYGLLSLLLLLYVLPGLSFFWDRYRVPVTLLIAGVVLALYSFFGTDHYYELNPPASEQLAAYEAPTVQHVLEGWTLPEDRQGQRTLIVVDASGGGIQAAAWTAQVLTGLHEVYGNGFTRSVGLISSVSGGSVGTMYYLGYRGEIDENFDAPRAAGQILTPEAIAQIRASSRASALEATAWGLAYPDAMRAIFPPAVGRTMDRGWAIEQVWRQRLAVGPSASLRRDELRLSHLGRASQHRQLPIAVFNATLMESGRRLQISPVLSPPSLGAEQSAGAVELLREFPEAQPRISTAARLSATFPYVTPAARSDSTANTAVASYHVVDGAYVDNEGVVTSVDWINRLLVYYSHPRRHDQRPFDRVVVLRIQAFPKEPVGTTAAPAPSASGWRSAILGPLDAMMSVRSASQTERGDLEIGLLTKATQASLEAIRERYQSELRSAQAVVDTLQETEPLNNAQPDSDHSPSASDLARRQSAAADALRLAELRRDEAAQRLSMIDDFQVVSVLFDFHSPQPVQIPLSWKLTHSQKQNIDRAWQSLLAGQHPHAPLEVLDRYFTRLPPSDQ